MNFKMRYADENNVKMRKLGAVYFRRKLNREWCKSGGCCSATLDNQKDTGYQGKVNLGPGLLGGGRNSTDA